MGPLRSYLPRINSRLAEGLKGHKTLVIFPEIRDDLAIRLYRKVTEFLLAESKTKSIYEINNAQKLHNFLEKDFHLLMLKIVQVLLDAVKEIQLAIENFKPWGAGLKEKMKIEFGGQFPGTRRCL